ncbi:hypothetical protein [Natronorubrum sp. FCH18a]|uniref:hypothetical protein n=1 Tax=Natronorubrum sp. FCH18a TaxID=3447018 RepID=UPI003F50E156
MKDELRQRRQETYRMLVAHGISHSEVVKRLSDSYDVSKSAIRKDIKNMNSWLPDLSVDFSAAIVRLTRLRDQQQELESVALQARRDGDPRTEIRARQEIRKSIMAEHNIATDVGLTPDSGEGAAALEEIDTGIDPEDEALLDEFCGIEGDLDAVELEGIR